ncbi:hypothetical protein BH18ACT4_BH18ACT4_06840 [soil metagenome]
MGLFGDSDGNMIRENDVVDNNVPFVGENSQASGIRIEGPGANGNLVGDNLVTGSGLDGIPIFADQSTGNFNTGNTIERNTVLDNGFGFLAARPGHGIILFIRANDNIVRDNEVHDNAGNGILAQFNVTLNEGAVNNLIEGNDARGNTLAAKPRAAYDLLDQNPQCDNNIWRNNLYLTAFPTCVRRGGGTPPA